MKKTSYQILILLSFDLYILSPSFILNASYHSSILVIGALHLYMPGEWGSVRISCAEVSGKILALQTCAQLKKKR
jgi:hypothetical protein